MVKDMTITRRKLLVGTATFAAYGLSDHAEALLPHGNTSAPIQNPPTDLWMEAPDVLAFTAKDDPITAGR